MPTRVIVPLVIFLSVASMVSGCWDLKEPNQLSYVLGSGWDRTDDGKIEVSVLIPLSRALSSGQTEGGGSKGKPFTVVTATGNNIFDAARHIQQKTSRIMFPGFRLALFINEGVARQGIAQFIDEIIRNPDSNTRSVLFVVKGMSAKQLMEMEYAMEMFPTTFAYRTNTSLGIKENTIYDYLREGNNPVKCFVLPVIVSDSSGQDNKMLIQEIALFNNEHKLVHYLKEHEAFLALWAAGKLSHTTITEHISEGNGTVSLDLQKLSRKMKVNVNGERIKVNLKLAGKGVIRENNTNLYLLSPAVKEKVAKELSEKAQKEILQVIGKVQKQYKTDIFGFGNEIGWKHPKEWKNLSNHWNDAFSNIDVSVEVKLTIQGVGQVGSGPKTIK